VLVVVAGRQEGRSTAAVRWLLQDENRILITRDQNTKQHLLQLVLKWSSEPARDSIPYYARRIVTLQDTRRGALRGLSISEIGVDDAELIFAMLLDVSKVAFVTIEGKAVRPSSLPSQSEETDS